MSRCFGLDVDMERRSHRFRERGGVGKKHHNASSSYPHVTIPFQVRHIHNGSGEAPLMVIWKRHKWDKHGNCTRCEAKRAPKSERALARKNAKAKAHVA